MPSLIIKTDIRTEPNTYGFDRLLATVTSTGKYNCFRFVSAKLEIREHDCLHYYILFFSE